LLSISLYHASYISTSLLRKFLYLVNEVNFVF
jgi:hypothetical protein